APAALPRHLELGADAAPDVEQAARPCLHPLDRLQELVRAAPEERPLRELVVRVNARVADRTLVLVRVRDRIRVDEPARAAAHEPPSSPAPWPVLTLPTERAIDLDHRATGNDGTRSSTSTIPRRSSRKFPAWIRPSTGGSAARKCA